MTDSQVYQSRVYSSAAIAVFPQITQARVFAMINVPAEFAEVSQAFVMTAAKFAPTVEVSQARVYALGQGRTANPRIRVWTFTLDEHEFVVFRLGDVKTLVYDVYSEQWVEWTSGDLPFWRANTGMNWLGGTRYGPEFGSNILVGDDVYGLLWFLDPEQPYDDSPDSARATQQIPFPRIVTGQVLAKGRQFIPCYAIFLAGDNHGLAGADFVPEVQLETSDNQGITFDDQGSITVTLDYDQNLPYEWLSLGHFGAPGRIFRITDNGVFARIDSMEMNDAG